MKTNLLILLISFYTLNLSAQVPESPLFGFEFTSGSLSNYVTSSSDTLIGSAYPIIDRFNSEDDAVLITSTLNGVSLGIDNINSATLSFWMKIPSNPASSRILQIFGQSGAGFRINLIGENIGLNLKTFDSNGAPYTIAGDADTNTNDEEWHHYVLRTTHTIANELQIDFFVDNVFFPNLSGIIIQDLPIVKFMKSANFQISPTGEFFDKLDDIYFYDSALTEAEIAQLFNHNPASPNNILEFRNNFKMSTYPNPTSSVVFFESEESIVSIDIFNLLGQRVVTFNNTNEIDISTLKNGIYTASVLTKSSKRNDIKIIKK